MDAQKRKSLEKAILCIDDEEIILKSLIIQLREYYGNKYYYEMASSGEEALLFIDDLVEDGVHTILVISDWLMPGIKGDELIVRIHEKYPNTVNIMLTGQADPASIKNAEENGDLFSCIRKPWDKEYLLSIIDSALGGLDDGN